MGVNRSIPTALRSGRQSTKCLSDFVIQEFFITAIVITSTRGELASPCNEARKFVTGSKDKSEIRCRRFHGPCEVFGVVLHSNKVGVFCKVEQKRCNLFRENQPIWKYDVPPESPFTADHNGSFILAPLETNGHLNVVNMQVLL